MADVTDDPIIRFYRGQAADHAGRTIEAIWRLDDRRLEQAHDFIQWLFPLPAPSRFNPDAPLLTPAAAAAFRQDEGLRDRVRRSLDLMLAFYGLRRVGERVERGADFAVKSAGWLSPGNHNHLRQSRIIQFLALAGESGLARSLQGLLLAIARAEGRGRISEETVRHWSGLL